MKLTPKTLLQQVKEIETHCLLLRQEAENAKRNHRKLRKSNSLYDEVAYHTFQIAIHNDLVRTGMERHKLEAPTPLANGTQLAW